MSDSNDRTKVRTDEGIQVLDEKVWKAWIAKGALREQRTANNRMQVVKCAGIAILAATAVLWRSLSELDFFIRLGVSLSGLAILSQAVRLRRYAFAAVFAALVLIYNPVVPVFPFSGTEAFTLVVATTVPFAASLVWLRPSSLVDEKPARPSNAVEVPLTPAEGRA